MTRVETIEESVTLPLELVPTIGNHSGVPFAVIEASAHVKLWHLIGWNDNVSGTVDQALDAEDYLEAPEGSNAVAAAEVLAKMLGKGTQSDAYTEKVDEWVKSVSIKPSPQLLDKAKRTLVRVAGDNSELKELWEEAGSDEWAASIKALQAAISA